MVTYAAVKDRGTNELWVRGVRGVRGFRFGLSATALGGRAEAALYGTLQPYMYSTRTSSTCRVASITSRINKSGDPPSYEG